MKYKPADIFFVAGEASGDLQASLVAQTVLQTRPGSYLEALGGQRLRAQGADVIYDTPELASIGPLSVIPRIPLLYGILRWIDASLRARPSRLLMPVDAGAFNLRLVTRLRRAGYAGSIVYYFPPGAWLDNPEQARTVAGTSTALTPFAHQRDFYRSLGLGVEYFGHPLVSVINERPQVALHAQPRIAVLPGSRREEVQRHMPVLAAAARQLRRETQATFVAVAASQRRAVQIRGLWERHQGPDGVVISSGQTAAVLRDADVAWVASGTAVLEAALVGVPQVMFYVVSPAQHRVAQRRLPPSLLRSIALPNLVMRREMVPELLQDGFQPDRLVEQTRHLLEHDGRRQRMLDDYRELRAALGPPDTLSRIGAYIVARMDSGTLI